MLANIFLSIYIIGAVISGIIISLEAIVADKRGEDISEFPMAFCTCVLFSWLYVFAFIMRNKKIK